MSETHPSKEETSGKEGESNFDSQEQSAAIVEQETELGSAASERSAAEKKESQTPEVSGTTDEEAEYEAEEEEEAEQAEEKEADAEKQSKNVESVLAGTSSATASAHKSETRSRGPSRTRTSRRSKRRQPLALNNCRIGFIGAGKMTEAIVTGLIKITKIEPKQIFIASKSGKNHDHFKQQGAITTRRSYDIFGRMDCDIVFLCLHGYVIKQLHKTGGTRPMALTTNYIPNQRHQLYILSLIGGVTLTEIKSTLLNPDNPDKYKLEMHRIMLNHSVSYGLGIGAIDVEPDSKKCGPIIRDLLTSLCKLEYIPENNMDVACAVGGNGITFCYYFLAAMADGAFKMGLPKMLAIKIASRTLQSAAASLLESGKHPTDLRDSCTSPSGPAIYGLHVLDKADCASGIAAAVEAAFRRIKELCDI